MITKQNPKEILLFSRFDSLLSPAAGKTLDRSWQNVSRRMALQLLPVDKIEGKFSENTGCPTKELYSVCGLILMMEYYGIKLIAPSPPQPEGEVGWSECKFVERPIEAVHASATIASPGTICCLSFHFCDSDHA